MSSLPLSVGTRGIVLADVTFGYGEVLVLDEESLAVPEGGVVVVTGENGVGKSTLLYLCAGLVAVAPYPGVVTLAGVRPERLSPSALFRRGVRRGFVFQQGSLLANLPALSNVGLALRYHADLLGLDEPAIDARSRAALDRVGVGRADYHALPAHLSYGVRKRVAIARALALDPNFAFFDDPDAGLDLESAGVVAGVLEALRDDPRVTVMVASNHRALLDRLGVQPLALEGGKLLARASRSVA